MKLKRVANAAVRNLLADQTNLRIMPSITITVNGIRTLLTKLNPDKAPGSIQVAFKNAISNIY